MLMSIKLCFKFKIMMKFKKLNGLTSLIYLLLMTIFYVYLNLNPLVNIFLRLTVLLTNILINLKTFIII